MRILIAGASGAIDRPLVRRVRTNHIAGACRRTIRSNAEGAAMITTRGFTGRGRAKADEKRVPPGQYVTEDFPVLSAGPTPHTPLDRWTLTLQDGGSLVGEWTWEEFQALPRTELTVDIHCVTKWSKLGTV